VDLFPLSVLLFSNRIFIADARSASEKWPFPFRRTSPTNHRHALIMRHRQRKAYASQHWKVPALHSSICTNADGGEAVSKSKSIECMRR
jgi:hypothetical protein